MNTLRDRTFNRLSRSFSNKTTDAHAVFNFYTYPFFANNTNVNLSDFFNSPDTMMSTQIEVLEKLEYCGNLMPDFGVVAETSALGGEVYFDENNYINVKSINIENVDDVLKLKAGNAFANNYMCKALEHLDFMVKNCPTGLEIEPHPIMGAFTIAAQLRGISDFCADIIDEPEMCKKLIDLAVETQINFINAQEKVFKKPLNHILICDDLSSFLSPALYLEFVVPAYKMLYEAFPHIEHRLHNDAFAHHLMSHISNLNIVAWQYGTDLTPTEAAAGVNNKISVMGGFDPVALSKLSEKETVQECKKLLESCGGNPKIVISTSGTINQVPYRNILAILKTVDDFKIIK